MFAQTEAGHPIPADTHQRGDSAVPLPHQRWEGEQTSVYTEEANCGRADQYAWMLYYSLWQGEIEGRRGVEKQEGDGKRKGGPAEEERSGTLIQ